MNLVKTRSYGASDINNIISNHSYNGIIDPAKDRFPCCIVWTPIPVISWLIPLLGHMGIALSSGVIRDFAGSYYVSEDDMAFGRPTKYWKLEQELASGGITGWDIAVTEASEIYKTRRHNFCCDNCHSHVATALNLMNYRNSSKWNMAKIAILMLVFGKYISFTGFCRTWGPFVIILIIFTIVIYLFLSLLI